MTLDAGLGATLVKEKGRGPREGEEMIVVLKKCPKCGRLFLTLWDRHCEVCQMDGGQVWPKGKEESDGS